MSTPNKPVYTSPDIVTFYSNQLSKFGDSPQGVGWKDEKAQFVRFEQLVKVIGNRNGFTINDLGCGTGKLYQYLRAAGYSPARYLGYDMLEAMLGAAAQLLSDAAEVTLKKIASAEEMEIADYTVASGIFNVKYEAREYEWLNYVLSTIHQMNEKSRLGFSLNLLTKYSDREFMQSYLYYADPLFFFDYCKRNFAKNVALLHDYDQYDFTIIVRKDQAKN